MRDTLERILGGDRLTEDEAAGVMDRLAAGGFDPVQAGAVLTALRARGETADEVRGFARAMRRLAKRPVLPRTAPTADTCGTGGDGSGSLNLSTGVALLAAACGVPIVKHGNRSVSSRSGSADVLEALGVALPLGEGAAFACLAETGFTFLFAPHHHPALAHVTPVRRALGVRTVFNLLGPLCNPATPPFQVAGAFSAEAARVMAGALAGLGVERAVVVHGAGGWDEATPVGPFLALEIAGGAVTERTRDPEELGFPRCDPAELRGGDAAENAARLRAVLECEERGGHRDAILLGAALVLEVTGAARDAREGAGIARATLDAGRAATLLDHLVTVSRRDHREAARA